MTTFDPGMDCDNAAFSGTDLSTEWAYAGLTKLQWAAVQVAAQLATVMLDASAEDIARRANEISTKVLEFSAP